MRADMCELTASSCSLSSIREGEQHRRADQVRKEREARSLAIEKAYVHDVYEQISANFSDSRYRAWPRVKQFLMDLEPGSFVCDVGCGSGKYLSINPMLFNLGSDRCRALAELAREKEHEVLICDNLSLPYRDESFDAVLSIAVIHHIATTERRVRAIRELARVLRVGGRIIISVWSMEQRHRKFESQDVLIPWHRPGPPSSDEKTCSSGVGDTTTTTCTSEDDVTHYHAYTQTGSDSEALSVSRMSLRRRGRSRYKGRSISPSGGRSSSDLSSPNETCYSFVRKAIKKLATNKKQQQQANAKLPWFFNNFESYYNKELEAWGQAELEKGESGDSNENDDIPIEIRHLEETSDLLAIPPLYPRPPSSSTRLQDETLSKSKSLDDLSKIGGKTKIKLRDQGRSLTCDDPTVTSRHQDNRREDNSPMKGKLQCAASSQSVQSSEAGGSSSWFSRSFLDKPRGGGSLSSLSSAKSAVSSISIKSDSGIGTSLAKFSKYDLKSRVWGSESELGCPKGSKEKERKEGSERSNLSRHLALSLGAIKKTNSKARSLNTLFKSTNFSIQTPEKEKSKAMQTIEGKLMVAIKEVNESDVSENNTPVPSPGPVSILQPLLKRKEQRPVLVKQKHSIQAFNFPDEREMAAHNHYRELRKELKPDSTRAPITPTIIPPPETPPASSHISPASSSPCGGDVDFVRIDLVKPVPLQHLLQVPGGDGKSTGGGSNQLIKQVSLNDELFCSERKMERESIRDQIQRQKSLPESYSQQEKPALGNIPARSFKESLLAAAQTKQFEIFRDGFTKFRSANSAKTAAESDNSSGSSGVNSLGGISGMASGIGSTVGGQQSVDQQDGKPQTSFTTGIAKILHRWKSEQDTCENQSQSSFTRKKGVNIDPINVFSLRRDQSLDSATRRGLFHKKGAWSPKSPKPDTHSPLENPCLLSPTVRRCCLECPDDTSVKKERRLSRGDGGGGSDSSKDSSIQSDTSLDSEDSCISVIFVPHPEKSKTEEGATKQSPQSQRSSTSNSSESSESPTNKGSPMSPGSKGLSPVKIHSKFKSSTRDQQVMGPQQQPNGNDPLLSAICSEEGRTDQGEKTSFTTLANIPECLEEPPESPHQPLSPKTSTLVIPSNCQRKHDHKSFELEDLPDESPINCHPHGVAERVEIVEDSSLPSSPHPYSSNSKFDYPIVKHHPLFAKSRSGISSLLLGENIEYMRKPGSRLSHGVQSVRKSTPKLLTFEIYNPETDDLDSDTSHSSSPDSDDSIVSVINEKLKLDDRINDSEKGELVEDNVKLIDIEIGQGVPESKKTSEEIGLIFDFDDIDRKSERRKECLINLLGENKTVLESLKESEWKTQSVKEVVLKTASQLQSMEELRGFSSGSSKGCSPEKERQSLEYKSSSLVFLPSIETTQSLLDNKSETLFASTSAPLVSSISAVTATNNEEIKISPLDIISTSITPTNTISPMAKTEVPEILNTVVSISHAQGTSKTELLLKRRQSSKKFDDDMPEIVISDESEISASSSDKSNGNILSETCSPEIDSKSGSSCTGSSDEKSPVKRSLEDVCKGEVIFSMTDLDANRSSLTLQQPVEEKSQENSHMKSDSVQESPVVVPSRRFDRKKRDDSVDSTTASVKSSVHHSDTGSVLSHRFSTISISSNVSSDVSFGNTSAVSGSSCYLASMSSADFDDRPVLASSFSMSEAEENEYLSLQGHEEEKEDGVKEPEETDVDGSKEGTKKDQLSPPRIDGRSQERPKLKSLFKRNGNNGSNNDCGSKSRSLHSSNESKSRDDEKSSISGKPQRSRIGTVSTITPDTSLDQNTCVEHGGGGSSSFEDELLRSFSKEETESNENVLSASDSEDSAEAGGSLTHHRYYHVFREGEIDHIIEKYVENLHIIRSYYDHANWCVVAEKVNVWTI